MSVSASPTITAQSDRRFIRRVFAVGTVLLLAQMAFSGVLLVVRPNPVMIVVRHLGYPDYFPLALGVAKLLGFLVLALPAPRRLKEWAYAGATFDLLAAAVSHFAAHDALSDRLGPLVMLILVAASYANFVEHTNDNSGRSR